jgi:hypothetical protein
MTWEELVKLEPHLENLLENIRHGFNKNWFGNDGYKADMIKLVGVMRLYQKQDSFGGRRDILFSSAAYDCAYKVLYEASNKK